MYFPTKYYDYPQACLVKVPMTFERAMNTPANILHDNKLDEIEIREVVQSIWKQRAVVLLFTGIGFAAAFGGSGGAIFPFVIGVLAQAKGVQVLQPIILALLVVIWTQTSEGSIRMGRA